MKKSILPPAALLAVIIFSPALPAETQSPSTPALPAPALHYAPAAPGHTLPNLGAARSQASLLLRKNTAKYLGNCEPAALVTGAGTGPFQRGRAIDLSANDGNGGKVTHCAGIMNGGFGGLAACTITLWYKPASPLPAARNVFTTLFNNASFSLIFSGDTLCAFARGTGKAEGAPDRMLAPRNPALAAEGEWHFAALAWDGADGTTTLCGGSESARAAVLKSARLVGTGKTIPDRGAISLGYHHLSDGGIRAFDGWLADIRVYTTALTPSQIEAVRVSAGNENEP
jgi:hypothetical protein